MPDHDTKPTPSPTASPTPAAGGEATEAKPGGFGAFAEVYRARWAANHPESGKRRQPDERQATTPSDTEDADPAGTDTPNRGASRAEGDLGGLHYEAGVEVSELSPRPPAPDPGAEAPASTGGAAGWESAGSTTDRRPQ